MAIKGEPEEGERPFSSVVPKDGENLEEKEKKKARLLISLPSPSHLLLFVTEEGSCEITKPQTISLRLSSFPLLAPQKKLLFLLHVFLFYSTLSDIRIPLLCQISILICLCSPPLQSPIAPPSLYIFLSDSSAGGRGLAERRSGSH